MWISCGKAPSVCQWLFEVGASSDITGANDGSLRCGLLAKKVISVCQWLFEVGAPAISPERTMMAPLRCTLLAKGHHRCQWLFEVGASADITRADNNGTTPMAACKWPSVGVSVVVRGGARPQTSPGRYHWHTPMFISCGMAIVGVSVVVRGGRPQTSPGRTMMASVQC